MTSNPSGVRITRAKGPATAPVLWYVERHGGRDFTVGIYPGVCERWNATSARWQQAATGFFAEIRERLTEQPGDTSATVRAFDRGSELLYATRDEAYTLGLRRLRAIIEHDASAERM